MALLYKQMIAQHHCTQESPQEVEIVIDLQGNIENSPAKQLRCKATNEYKGHDDTRIKKVKMDSVGETSVQSEQSAPTAQSTAPKVDPSIASLNRIKQKVMITLGIIIQDRYRVEKFIDDGTFGRCLLALDIQTQELKVLKIVKNYQKYINMTIEEAKTHRAILDKVNDQRHIVLMYDSFFFQDDYVIVMERLGINLYQRLLKQNRFTIDQVRRIGIQILQGLNQLHAIQLIHTDLKPENICFKECLVDESQPICLDIKIIDYGTAFWFKEKRQQVIQTRQYRAPEVILECGSWDHKVDLWSVGCILYELVAGRLLFQVDEKHGLSNSSVHMTTIHQVILLQKELGPIPSHMIKQSKNTMLKTFFQKPFIFKKSIAIISHVKSKLMGHVQYESQSLFDLLHSLLTIDPALRPDCQQALAHPFFQEQS